ncbi:carbamoyltransferase [Candidatus Pacearchaeota archaeon]|nr:carbamoyltransferase [Candidatus Pacearchaeota archaeon]
MYILGLSCFYHDSAATLVKDGVVVAAAQEERFTRKKHDTGFPLHAVEYCLESQGITIKDIGYIAFYEKPMLKFERLLHQHIEYFPKTYKIFLSNMPSWFNEKLRVLKNIKKKLSYKGDVLFIEHHLAHAASSFLLSPFKKAAIVTADGVGEWTTTAYGIGNRNKITLLKEIKFPSSIGLLYSTITAYLGFSVNNSEYKVMGLASYGNMDPKTNPYYSKIMSIIDIKKDGSYRFNMDYFDYSFKNRMPSKKLCILLGGKIRKPESELNSRHKDIAAAVQLVTETLMTNILNYVQQQTKCKEIVISGGVALNSVYNGKILRKTKFKKIWIQPDPGDGGTSMGAALYAYNCILNNKRKYVLKNVYLGPSYTTEQIRQVLNENNIKYIEFSGQKELIQKTADLLVKNQVIGWFQKGMEWGPRALGARSILSNPCNPNMQEILNLKVKHREKFRPFAPVVCIDDAQKYFDCDKPIPEITDFMLMVYPIHRKWHAKIPAVTHVDGSGRLQTIRRSQNESYYDIIKAFGKLSGIPILINTSFNIRGEPIVCTPQEAYRCMMGTGIDSLVMDKFLIHRTDNIHDAWNSEKYAKD